MKFSIILAVDDKNWFWKDWYLPWKIKKDMQYFKEKTVQTENPNKINAVIMGRKTWDSIPEKYRPLPWRLNFVLTRNPDYSDEWCVVFSSFEKCMETIQLNPSVESVFIMGWATLYNDALHNPDLEKIYITKVEWNYNCDVFFDWVPESFVLEWESEQQAENEIQFTFQVYKKAD